MLTPVGRNPKNRHQPSAPGAIPTMRLRPLGSRLNGSAATPDPGTAPKLGLHACAVGEPDCLSCSRYSACTLLDKGYGKRCDKFAAFQTLMNLDDFDKMEDVAQPFAERAIRRQTTTFGGGVMSNQKIEDLLDEVLATAENSSPIDFKIDDRDLPEAKNFFEFAISKSFLNTRPYPKQIEIGLNLFSDFCPRCTNPKWVLPHRGELNIPFDTDYVDYGELLDNVQLLEFGICPKCHTNKGELWTQFGIKDFNELIGVAGQRGGKSWLVALLSAYTIHRYMKLQNPLRTFNLDANGMLHATFTAIDLGQARRAVFTPLYNMASDSHWFTEYHKMLDYYGNKFGEEIYHFKELSFGYNHRRLLIYPATPSKKGLRGATRFCGCLTGDTLVNTDQGLIRLDDTQNLLMSQAQFGANAAPIIRHFDQGKKPTFRLTLDTGAWLDGTANHEIPVLGPNYEIVKKPLGHLTAQDTVLVQLGGAFPAQAPALGFTHENKTLLKDLVVERMKALAEFSYHDFADLVTKNHFYTYTSTARKNGWIEKSGSTIKTATVPVKKYRVTARGHAEFFPEPSSFTRREHRFPTHLTEELATLLGYMVSEGAYADGATEFTFSNTDKTVVDHFAASYEKTFGVKPRVGGPYQKPDPLHKPYWRVSMAYETVKTFFRHVGLNPSTAGTKTVPWPILRATKPQARAFLAALYEGDGTTFRNTLTNIGTIVGYASKSRTLLHELQVLLLKFEVVTSLHTSGDATPNIRTDTIYDAQKFAAEIGFMTARKNVPIKNIQRSGSLLARRYSLPDHVPTLAKGRYSVKARLWVAKELDEPVLSDFSFSALTPLQQRNVQKIVGQGFAFARPVSRKYIGEQHVYDIMVDHESHVYTANGLQCGNSIDELGWFFAAQKGSIKLDPDEVYSAMVNSFLTVRSAVTKLHQKGIFHVPPPLFANVTSPSSARDKAMRLLMEVEKTVNIFGFKYASNQMNPSLDPRELAAIEAVDPSAYKRDFMAEPPDAANPFIGNRKAAEQVTRPKFKNKVLLSQTVGTSATGTQMTTATVKIHNSVALEEKTCVLALDAGEKNNSFAGAVVSLQETENTEQSAVLVEAMFEIIPKPGYPINFNSIYTNVIVPICEAFNVQFVTADRWQSKKLLEDLEEELEISQNTYSLKYEDFMDFRDAIYNGLIKGPRMEKGIEFKDAYAKGGTREYPHNFIGTPIAHFQAQLVTVEDNFGKTVAKGEKMTDDLFRAVVLGYSMITDREVQELYLMGAPDRSRRGATLGVVGSYSSLNGAATTGGTNGVSGVAAMGSLMSRGGGAPANSGMVFSGTRR